MNIFITYSNNKKMVKQKQTNEVSIGFAFNVNVPLELMNIMQLCISLNNPISVICDKTTGIISDGINYTCHKWKTLYPRMICGHNVFPSGTAPDSYSRLLGSFPPRAEQD